jgi:hypothetical protein
MVIAIAVLVAGVSARGAPDDTKEKPKPGTPAEQYKALIKEYDQGMKEYRALLSKATTDEERKTAFEKRPQLDKYTASLLELAQKHPKDSAAVDALVWILRHFGGDVDKVCGLLQPHNQDPRLAEIVENLRYFSTPTVEKLLRAVADKNPNRTAQGRACLALAMSLKEKKEADRFHTRVLEKYAEIKTQGGATLADAVKAPQFEKDHLVVRKTAPDIEGTDIDNKKFKLADYRGKVVLLDFWGNW